MVSRIWIVNALLAAVLVFGGMGVWDAWRREAPPTGTAAVKGKTARPFQAPPENQLLSSAEYPEVVERNLFSEDRSAPAPPAPPETAEPETVQEEVRVDGKKIILYGVVLFGDYKAALINNPEIQGKNPQNQWIKEGGRIGNLTVRQILQDRVVLADADASYRVLLYDPEKVQKAASAQKTPPSAKPNVVSVGEAPVAKPVVKADAPPKAQSSPAEVRSISEDGQYEIIDTPLGQIKRKRK